MARDKKRSPEVEEVRAYVEGVAKNLADRLWGPKGPPWGTKLSQLEDLVVDIREVLSELESIAFPRAIARSPELERIACRSQRLTGGIPT